MKKLDSQKPSLNRKMFKQDSIRKPSAGSKSTLRLFTDLNKAKKLFR